MYFKKDSIPSRNFLLYENIKKNMDALYEHSEKILKLTRSGKYALAEFKDYFIWLLKLHETTENLMKNIMENMKKLYDIVNYL
jgi:tRNA-dihydrouridine synthase